MLPSWAVHQVGSYLGYSGSAGDVVARAALDPKETFAWHRIAIVRVTTRLLSISVSDSLPDHGPPFLRIGFYRSAEPHWVGPLTFSNTTIVRPSRPSTLLLKGAVVMVRVFPSSL